MMFSKRIRLRYLCNTKKSRIRRRNDRDNLISEVMGMGIGFSEERILNKRKRVESNCNKVRKKRKTRKRVDVNHNRVRKKQKITGNHGEIDQISELPEPIIHHILSFLHCTKDVARTAILSRNWKSVFNSYHSFDFDEKWFRESRGREKDNRIQALEAQKTRFRSYIEDSIATRLEPLVSIDKFRLYVENFDNTYMVSLIHSAIDKNVKELDIQVHKDEVFMIPFKLVDYPSIVSLKLSGTILNDFKAVRLCNLREFSIKGSRLFTGSMMEKIAENCPLLEDLRLICCPSLAYISIKSLVKLRRVEVQDCTFLFEIEIESSNRLESFWYHGKKDMLCKIDLRNTENLKNLTLKDNTMSESLLEDWIVKCPLLERLVLHECTRLDQFRISSDKLKSLALIKCVNLLDVYIEAPNLCSFEYSGHTIPFRSVNASCLSRAKLSIPPNQIKDIFGDFDGIKGLKLILYSKKNMKIFEDPRDALKDENSLQKLELTASSTSVVKTVDNWLRECQGKSLILISSNDELMKLISRMIMEREDHPSCCRYNFNKCWRHYMEDVKVSTLEIGNGTCYDFTWRSRKN